MKKYVCLLTLFFMVLICGCGSSPESQGKALSKQISAAQLMELSIYPKLSSRGYVFGLQEMLISDYKKYCEKCGVPFDKPFIKILKKGFPDVQVSVKHQVIRKSDNPFEKNDTVFAIEYKVDATKNKEQSYLAVFVFIVASTPEGTSVIKIGGYDECNGKKTLFTTPEQMLIRIGAIGKDFDTMVQKLTKIYTQKEEDK